MREFPDKNLHTTNPEGVDGKERDDGRHVVYCF
jgi:hypothetical protein